MAPQSARDHAHSILPDSVDYGADGDEGVDGETVTPMIHQMFSSMSCDKVQAKKKEMKRRMRMAEVACSVLRGDHAMQYSLDRVEMRFVA